MTRGLASLVLALTAAVLAAVVPFSTLGIAAGCTFSLGFAALHDLIPDVVGDCLTDEQHNPANGDGLQPTTRGLLVWRKADNLTAFTDGARTWINGPFGLQQRLNSERFDWERDQPATYPSSADAVRMPVNTFTGGGFYQRVDLPGEGSPVPAFERWYNSPDVVVGPLGPGWTHNYNVRLITPNGIPDALAIAMPNGRRDIFRQRPDGSYAPPLGVDTTLVRNPPSAPLWYTATLGDGTQWHFRNDGSLKRITQPDGREIELFYGSGVGSLRLTSVGPPDAEGSLLVEWDGQANRVVAVRRVGRPGQVVRYGYDARGRLERTVDVDGKTNRFAYDGDSQRITTVWDATGRVAIANTYDARERIVAQRSALRDFDGPPTTLEYAENPDGSRATTVRVPRREDPNGWPLTREHRYSPEGVLRSELLKPSPDPATWRLTEYRYNSPMTARGAVVLDGLSDPQ